MKENDILSTDLVPPIFLEIVTKYIYPRAPEFRTKTNEFSIVFLKFKEFYILSAELQERIMQIVRKRLVTDEKHTPIAVQIDYNDWLKIEQQLNIQETPDQTTDLSHHAGTLKLTESALTYQARCRSEWS